MSLCDRASAREFALQTLCSTSLAEEIVELSGGVKHGAEIVVALERRKNKCGTNKSRYEAKFIIWRIIL